MKYAIKAEDGSYMRHPGECGSSHTFENGWNSDLEDANLFDSEEGALYRINNYGFGKWLRAKIVPVEIVEKLSPKFLFIANKPSSEDYCRGCLMASYDSDFIMESMLTPEELVKKWSEIIHYNMNLRCSEEGYESYVFKDGIKVWDKNNVEWDGENKYDNYEYEEEIEKQKKYDMSEILNLHKQAKNIAELLEKSKKEKERKEAEAKRLKEEAKDKEERRKQFDKLKEEFNEH